MIKDKLRDSNAFWTEYCSETTRLRLGDADREIVRNLLVKLAETLPNAAHSTPKLWTPESAEQPLVAIGRLDKAKRVVPPKLGLCVIGSGVHLWTTGELIEEFQEAHPHATGHELLWTDWRPDDMYRCTLDPVTVDDLTRGPLSDLAEWLAEKIEQVGRGGVACPKEISPGPTHSRRPSVNRSTGPQSSISANVQANILDRRVLDIQTYKCSFHDVLTVVQAPVDSRSLPFLDLAFGPKRDQQTRADLCGPGVYGIAFEDRLGSERLVYVGSFLGAAHDRFAGNVAESRWWTHAASFILRGHRITVGKRTQRRFEGLDGALLGLSSTSVVKLPLGDMGCCAGINRVAFAVANWSEFGPAAFTHEDKNQLLRRFRIVYIRIAGINPPVASSALCTSVRHTEQELILRLCPPCNWQHNEKRCTGRWRLDDFESAAVDLLRKQLNG